MEREYLIKQHNEFLTQVREEAKGLFWFHDFFFVIESTLLGAIFLGKVTIGYMHFAEIVGFLISMYWFFVIRKQRLWRNDWIIRIQEIETSLQFPEQFILWPKKVKTAGRWRGYFFGKRGLWRTLFLLPFGFATAWVVLFFYF